MVITAFSRISSFETNIFISLFSQSFGKIFVFKKAHNINSKGTEQNEKN